MGIFDAPEYHDHEQILFINDRETSLKGIIAIHSTTLGPALGGCRVWNYPSEAHGLHDVLRLSRGMTYKAALANVPLGGGKSVILMNEDTQKTPELMRAMGRAIEKLNGQYITGPDIGTGVEDMTIINEVTRYVIGVAKDHGGFGDPSVSTSKGVFHAIRAALTHKFGSPDLNQVKVAVQGLGHVGYKLCRLLKDEGAELFVADLNQEKVKQAQSEFEATVVDVAEISKAEVDVFAPCAMGAVINDQGIDQIKASIIAGGANNQLEHDRHGEALKERGILYIPDYVANGGGLIQVTAEWYQEGMDSFSEKVDAIYDTCLDILKRAEQDDVPTSVASDLIAEDRIREKLNSKPVVDESQWS